MAVLTLLAVMCQDPAAAGSVVSSEQLREHLSCLRDAVDGMTVEYVQRTYRGKGRVPEGEPDATLLAEEVRCLVTLSGDRFRKETRQVQVDPRGGARPGDVTVETWDGYVRRVRYAGAQPTGSVDARFNRVIQIHDAETYWLGVAGHSGREMRLEEMFDHESLRGPFLRHDGRTEWQVQDPECWDLVSDRFEDHVCRVVAEPRADGSPWLSEILVRRVNTHGDRSAMVVRTTAYSRDVLSEEIPLAQRLVYTDATTWVGGEPFWSRTIIELIAVRPAVIDNNTFAVTFLDGDEVYDSRCGMKYIVGSNLIELPRRREGAILTDQPLRGAVAERLPQLVTSGRIGELDVPPPRAAWEAIGTDDLDLPAERKHDFGDDANMNWASGKYHVFTVRNGGDRAVTITDITSTGPSIDTVWLGYLTKEERGSDIVQGGMTGVGTVLEPGESKRMYVSMSFGIGLWRHAAILTTDTGERWHYQLSVTGVIDPIAEVFVRKPPAPGSDRVPVGLRLITGEEESDPIEVVGPEGVAVEFDQWLTLVPFHFMAGSPMQQLAHFTIDLSSYDGTYPVQVKLRTALGVEATAYVRAEPE